MSTIQPDAHPSPAENTVAELDAAPPQYQLPPKKSKLGMIWGKSLPPRSISTFPQAEP